MPVSRSRSWPGLRGRRSECDRLSGLVAEVQAGHSQVLVLRGEAGIGKTALLEFLVDRAAACRVARAGGVESETALAYAVLHQLCSPYLDRVHGLPSPQQDALGIAFGTRPGGAPDRFLLGLAVLALLSEVAEEMPLICVVDDAQWLDQASAQTLEFVARRLGAEQMGMVFAVRETDTGPRLAGLPELAVRGLRSGDAAELLEQAVPWPLDPRVRDRVLAESHGNPLALTELPRGLTATELAFGGNGASSPTPTGQPPRARIRAPVGPPPAAVTAPAPGRRVEPVGDATVVWRAAERAGHRDRCGDRGRGGRADRAPTTGYSSGIRSCARPPTARRHRRNGGGYTRALATSPTPTSILIAVPGTARCRWWARTRRSRPNSTALLIVRTRPADWRQQQRSSERRRS